MKTQQKANSVGTSFITEKYPYILGELCIVSIKRGKTIIVNADHSTENTSYDDWIYNSSLRNVCLYTRT